MSKSDELCNENEDLCLKNDFAASDQQWLECGADESLRSCAELGWALDNQQVGAGSGIGGGGTEFVCAEADAMSGQCHADIDFFSAMQLCVNTGARLCTLGEVQGREAEGHESGSCGHTGRVWTSSREDCGASVRRPSTCMRFQLFWK